MGKENKTTEILLDKIWFLIIPIIGGILIIIGLVTLIKWIIRLF
jgi:hypothetical protein